MKLSATAAAALLAATSAAPSAPSRTTSWRVRLAGPGCDHEDLGAIFDEDAWPVHNSTFTFDAYTDHVNLDHALSKLRPGCAVVEQEQGRPGRDFLVPDGYRPPNEMDELFQLLAIEHPERAQILDLTEELGTPTTAEGRRIYAMKISDNVGTDEDEPNLLLVGMHHAREIMAPETVLVVARNLLTSDSAEVTRLVEGNQIYLAWDFNPDGYRYVFDVDNNWRKNRLPNAGGSFGVDLNRNYPFGWDFSCGGSTNPSSGTYRGPGAGSEAEVTTMVAWQADRQFAMIVDLHSFGRDVRQNYAECATLPPELDSEYTSIVSVVAADMGYVPVRSCCTGGEISYAFSTHGSLAILFEQGTTFQPPFLDTIRESEEENWPGIRNFFSLPLPLSGHVRDATTGAPVTAQLRTPGFAWNYGEFVTTRASTGRFHLWLPTGTHTVVVTAEGYAPLSQELEASRESGVVEELLLTPVARNSTH